MGTEGDLRVAEEIFSYLRLSCLLHVRFLAIDAAAGFVEFDDGDGFVGAGAVTVESTGHVAVETFGAEDYQYVDCRCCPVSAFRYAKVGDDILENSATTCCMISYPPFP